MVCAQHKFYIANYSPAITFVHSFILQIMTPFILRRLKSDVELNLPPKQELLVYAPLTEHQRTFYEATVDKTIHQLLNKDDENVSGMAW